MKQAFLVLATIVLSSVIKAQDVSITHQLPVEVAAGITFEADFKINKGSLGGFAKYQMDLPTGYSAKSIDCVGGNFTFENQRIKIVWVSVPADPSFEVKLEITVPQNATGTFALVSKFYYLENNVKKEAEMPTHTIRISDRNGLETNVAETTTPDETPEEALTNTVTPVETNTVATTPVETNTVTTTPVETNTVATTPVETNTVATTPVETNTVATTPVETNNNVSTTENKTSSSSSNTVYKIQVGAFSNKPDKSKFPGANVTIVEEGGYYKALSGNFKSIQEAQAHKEKLISKGYDALIVIYENGKRTGMQR